MTETKVVAMAGAVCEREGAEPARDAYWQGQVDHSDDPMALIDRDGRTLSTTAAFDKLLGAAPWSGAPDEQARIDAAIARATARVAPAAAAVRFRRGGDTLILIVRPIPWATRLLHAPAGVAVATLLAPNRRPAPAPQLWQEAFDLTPAETTLATLLMAGHSLESAAAARDCRPATLRVHLRHIFGKTGVSRQSELVALLGRMGRG